MRHILPIIFTVLAFAFAAHGQVPLNEFLNPSLPSLSNEKPYLDPTFRWSMSGRVQASINEGRNLLAEGKSSVALQNFKFAAELDPRLWVGHYYKGVAFKLLNQLDSAENSFKKCIALNGPLSESYIELGQVYERKNNFRKAEASFEYSIKLNPSLGYPHYLIGNLALAKQDLKKAKKHYSQCAEINPKFSGAFVRLGMLECIAYNSFAAGLSYFESALKADSLQPEAILWRSLASIHQRNFGKAITDLNKIVRLNPSNTKLLMLRGLCFVEMNDFEKAYVDLRKTIQSSPVDESDFVGAQTMEDKRIDVSNATHYMINNIYGLDEESATLMKKAFCYMLTGKYQEAIATFETIEKTKVTSTSQFLKALAYENTGNHNFAYRHYDKALEFDPDLFDAHKKRGIYRTELKNYTGALDDFNEMIRINQKSPLPYRFRGLVYFNQKKYELAIADFTQYLKIDTLNREVLSFRASAYRELGKLNLAAYDYLNSWNDRPKHYESSLGFAIDALLKAGDTLSSIQFLRKYINKYPSYSRPYHVMAKIWMNQKKWDKADSLLEKGLAEIELDDPNYNEEYSYLLSSLGAAALGKKSYGKAKEYLDKAILSNSYNPEAFFYRGRLRMRNTTMKHEALEDLQRAANLGMPEAKQLLEQVRKQ